jgi:hypothetical protein
MNLQQLQALRTALITAMARGVLIVRSGDQQVQYQSIGDMQKALVILDYEISVLQPRTSRTSYAAFSKG